MTELYSLHVELLTVRLSQLSILVHSKCIITFGVRCWVKCCRNVVMAVAREAERASLMQHSTWFVSSQSRLHAKQRPSILLSSFWSRRPVGSRSFINLDVCIRCPVASDHNACPKCGHAMLSKVSSFQGELRPLVVWERASKYSLMPGACAAVRR
jgi:hypothetical protein